MSTGSLLFFKTHQNIIFIKKINKFKEYNDFIVQVMMRKELNGQIVTKKLICFYEKRQFFYFKMWGMGLNIGIEIFNRGLVSSLQFEDF